jgi:hypothetical protein
MKGELEQHIEKCQQALALIADPRVRVFLKKFLDDAENAGSEQAFIVPAPQSSIPAPPTAEKPTTKHSFRGTLTQTAWESVQRMPMEKSFTAQKLIESMRRAGYQFGGDHPEISIHAALHSLKKAGLVKITKRGRGRRPTLWRRMKESSYPT